MKTPVVTAFMAASTSLSPSNKHSTILTVIRFALFLLIAVLSYFGITGLIEHQQPEVEYFTPKPPPSEVAVDLPAKALGNFAIDTRASQQWLKTQAVLNAESKLTFAARHQTEAQLSFNGKTLWLTGLESAIVVEILEVTDSFIKLKMNMPPGSAQQSYTAFLQWDKTGGLWYNTYTHLQNGENKLYRARYTRAKSK